MNQLLTQLAQLLARLGARMPKPKRPGKPSGKPLKVAVVVGHNARAQGAYAGAPLNMSEWVFNRQVAEAMQALAPQVDPALTLGVFYRSSAPGLGFAQEIRAVYAQTDAWGADASMELHFNAAASSKARYAVTLSNGSPDSLALAQALDAAFEREWPDKPAHIWDKSKGQVRRGGLSLISGKAPAVLPEPFFGTNPQSLHEVQRLGTDGLARLYLSALKTYRQGL